MEVSAAAMQLVCHCCSQGANGGRASSATIARLWLQLQKLPLLNMTQENQAHQPLRWVAINWHDGTQPAA